MINAMQSALKLTGVGSYPWWCRGYEDVDYSSNDTGKSPTY